MAHFLFGLTLSVLLLYKNKTKQRVPSPLLFWVVSHPFNKAQRHDQKSIDGIKCLSLFFLAHTYMHLHTCVCMCVDNKSFGDWLMVSLFVCFFYCLFFVFAALFAVALNKMQYKWDVQKHVNWKNKGRKNDLHAFALKKKQTRSNTRSPPQKFDHIKHTFPHPKKEHSPKKKHHQNHKNPNQPTKNPNSLIHHPSTIQKLIIIIVREKKNFPNIIRNHNIPQIHKEKWDIWL